MCKVTEDPPSGVSYFGPRNTTLLSLQVTQEGSSSFFRGSFVYRLSVELR